MSDLILDLTGNSDTRDRLRALLPVDAEVLQLEDLKRLGAWGALRRIRRKRAATCYTVVSEARTPGRWLTLLSLALLARARRRVLLDRAGRRLRLSWARLLFRELPFAARRAVISVSVRRGARRRLSRLRPAPPRAPIRPTRIAFVRADLGPALTTGGSLAHIRGVIRGFVQQGKTIELISPAPVAGVEGAGVETTIVPADSRYGISVELPHLAYDRTLLPRLLHVLRERGAELIYQRHALGSSAAAVAARRTGLPLVLEYNGPEVWIARHWGAARKHLDLFAEIERRSLRAADLVVAVSAALREPLRAAGVAEERVLVNPNGVDPDRFAGPSLAGARERIRERLGVGPRRLVAGFVGTFGPWHGAEVLAEAICRSSPETRDRCHFVFVGEGPRRHRAEALLASAGAGASATFTGAVGFDEIPGYLAAFDVCVSPHVPNEDGTEFFGSPTKLFEYMASGRPVIASRLGQIAEVLRHGENAWLVPPGDPAALLDALVRLLGDATLRRELAETARRDVTRDHSWNAHVGRILDRLAAADRPREAPPVPLRRAGATSDTSR